MSEDSILLDIARKEKEIGFDSYSSFDGYNCS
jgi:hypothetical protein